MCKSFDELEFTDNFMFTKIMYENMDLCCELLELILQKPVELVPNQTEYEKTIKKRIDAKGVRLDVYVKDETQTVYDIEMQVRSDQNLPKRSRYYHSMIDLDLLGPGKNYSTLKPSYVIFILKRRPDETYTNPVYTFRYQCQEHPSVYLGDDTWTVFINADSDYTGLSEKMKTFLAYVKTGKVSDEVDSFVERLAEAVQRGRLNEEWRSEYVTVEDFGNERYLEGREEGWKEGREEGKKEGRKEERINTERERARADAEKQRADAEKQHSEALKALLDRYIEQFGKLPE